MLRALKYRLRAAIAPVLFIAITAYFGWNAVHGARGLEAQRLERANLVNAQAAFATVDAARAQWETRIADLDNRSIGKDMLDDQARLILNLADPSDIVVQLPPARH